MLGKSTKNINRQAFKKVGKDKHEILFLLPPNIEFSDFAKPDNYISNIKKGSKLFGSVLTDMPLGVLSLSAFLKKEINLVSTCLDFNVTLNKLETFKYSNFKSYFRDEILKKIGTNYRPDYIAISTMFTAAYQSSIDLTVLCRELFPKALILVGGNLPTAMYKEILNDSDAVDAICYGEGEKAFLGLIQAKGKSEYLNLSESWITHEKLKNSRVKYSHDFVWDLDEIPFLDYDMLDIEGYKLNPTSSRYSVTDSYSVSKETNLEDKIGKMLFKQDMSEHFMPIMTSRGCPFKCTFCASHAAHGRAMRYNSVARVEEDLKVMKERYGLTGVVIQDDHFMGGKRRPYELVSAMGKLKLGMFFQNALAMYALDIEFLQLLKKSGVDELVLPIESGSMRVLREEMRKPLKLSTIPQVVKNCRNEGIYTDCNIIIGMPGETKEDIAESREFLKSIYADWFRIFIATPIPGSEMHQTVVNENLFKSSLIRSNFKRAVIETEFLTPDYIQYMTYYMNIELNFVYNSNMRLGRYGVALEGFKNVLRIKPDHAIAHYYAGQCLEKLGQKSESTSHLIKAQEIVDSNNFWNPFINDFNIDLRPSYDSKIA